MQAFVLAGGLGTRMGRDKALLSVDGRPLIAHMLAKLAELGIRASICGNRPDLAAFAPAIADNFSQCGPLGGIEAALASSGSALNLFLAVDLPGMPVSFLRWLMARAERTQAAATIPYLAGRPQPLCAVYHRNLAGGLRNALRAGDYGVMRTIEGAAPTIDRLQVEQLMAADALEPRPLEPPHLWFQNLNTPAELARYLRGSSAKLRRGFD
jgi:molybdenum cofactor guanylyltransferase